MEICVPFWQDKLAGNKNQGPPNTRMNVANLSVCTEQTPQISRPSVSFMKYNVTFEILTPLTIIYKRNKKRCSHFATIWTSYARFAVIIVFTNHRKIATDIVLKVVVKSPAVHTRDLASPEIAAEIAPQITA